MLSCSLIAIMDSVTFARSQNQESDSAAKRRWETEERNPAQFQQLPCNDLKEDATTDPPQGALKRFYYQG
jgi:hypothetical protein